MSRLASLWRKLTRVWRRDAIGRDLAEEMRHHLESRAQEHIAAGMSEREAYRAARLAFGNPASLAERSREAWSFLRLETWLGDVAYGARLLWRDRGWSSIAAGTLALGIGGTVSVFTFVNAFLLRPLPFHDPDRLVHIWGADARLPARLNRVSVPVFLELRRQVTLFTDLAAFNYTEEDLTGSGEPERVSAGRVTANAFALLGVEPALGRTLGAGADAPGAPAEVVLSDAFWRTRFDANPRVLGRVLHLNGEPHTVVGVMPPDFVFPLPTTELWAPRVLDPSAGRQIRYLQVFGRLQPDVAPAQSSAELQAIAARIADRHPEEHADLAFRLEPLREALNFASDILPSMSAVLGVSVILLLALVCANVANLMLARGVARTHEIAVRAALGAGRWRLVRQLLTESVLLGICGGALGVLLASWSLSRIASTVPPDLYRVGALAIDREALAFALGVSLLSVALFGILPAFRGTQPDPGDVLKQSGRSAGAPPHRRSHRLLVAGQIAMSTVLLVGAALTIGSVRELRRVPLGFEPDGVLTAKLVLPANRYGSAADVAGFHRHLLERASGLPGVTAAATVDYLPLNHEFPVAEAFATGPPAAAGEGLQATELSVSAAYFTVMSIPLLQGRTFTEADDARGPAVAIVSQPLAERLFGETGAVGQELVVRDRAGAVRSYQIAGVVAAARHRTLKDAPDHHIYLAQIQHPGPYFRMILRTSSAPGTHAAAVRDVVRSVDSQLPVTEIRTMTEVVEEFLAPEIHISSALAEQSATALALALVGLYGVTAFMVALRRKEIAVRIALGASRRQILRLIVGDGVRTGTLGILLGLAAAYGLTRLLSTFLFGVTAFDPAVFAGVAALLLMCSGLACHLPARRATRVDPMRTLRLEG